ncbi:response regulator [Cohnella sp. WQ 127256]|uniref:response regulator n=1 Tax=Cohnella sp. WQ 127256 TaxID=2938790 RepID=UPI002118EEFE|nr:response regulator [Cohnella sp. WQ 127256]
MHTVLIVDDDAMIVKGLELIVDWSGMGFEIVGTARDGEEGFQAVQQLRPDIVLTDIKMPYKSGLEMIEDCLSNGLQPAFVVLTGFNEFEYAKRALKSRVADYLLKPIDEAELISVLTNIRTQLADGERRKSDLSALERRLQESYPILREKFIGDMVKGSLTPIELSEENLKYYDIRLAGDVFQIVMLDQEFADTDEDQRMLSEMKLMEIIQEALGQCGIYALVARIEERMVVVLSGEGDEFLRLREGLESIQRAADKWLGLRLTIGVSTTAGREELPTLYTEVVTAVRYKMYEGKGSVIYYSQLNRLDQSTYGYLEDQARLLISGVSEMDVEKVYAVIDDLFEKIQRTGMLSPDSVYRMCTEILFETRKALTEIGVNMDDIVDEDIFSKKVMSRYETLEELKHWLGVIFKNTIDFIDRRSSRVNGEPIDPIILFMNANYDKNIDLELISKTFYIDPSYFCKVFKKTTGVTYLSYLTQIRMAKACEFLKNPQNKVYEIAGKTGYEDQRYFSQVFRKHTGMTPSDYQRIQTKN